MCEADATALLDFSEKVPAQVLPLYINLFNNKLGYRDIKCQWLAIALLQSKG
jgi:hypothetical protein